MNPISKGVKITQFRDIPQFTDIGHYAVDYPIDRLISFLEDEIRDYGLQLNPEFQRGHVWTRKQQIAYVEFLLRGGRTGRDCISTIQAGTGLLLLVYTTIMSA